MNFNQFINNIVVMRIFVSKKKTHLLEVAVAPPPNKFVAGVAVFALPNGDAAKLFCGGEAPPKSDGAVLVAALPPNTF